MSRAVGSAWIALVTATSIRWLWLFWTSRCNEACAEQTAGLCDRPHRPAVCNTLGAMKHLLTFAFVFAAPLLLATTVATGCSSDRTVVKSRAAEWKAKLDSAVPPGAPLESAKKWGETAGISFTYLEKERQLYAQAERIPETGFNKLVCSEWWIVVKITFTDGGVSEKNEVSTVGACI